MTGVLVADDHSLIREGLRRLIDAQPDLDVCAEAADGRQVLDLVAASQPEVVVLDISMPGLGGLETLEQLRRSHPKIKVLLLSMYGDSEHVQNAVALGADGYLLKTASPREVLEALRSVLKGGNYYSPAIAKEVVRQLRAPEDDDQSPFAMLSKREREVLTFIAEGLSAKQIADRLEIATKTVEAHRTSLMRKLGVRKATGLVRYALRHGLIQP